VLIIEDLTRLRLRIDTLYYLYIRLLNVLTELRFTLNLILLLPLTTLEYRKVINRKPHL